MSELLPAFRLGDIRGLYPSQIDEVFVEAFAHAFVGHFPQSAAVAVGRDMRESSGLLHSALMETLASVGVPVIDIGMCPTELGYFASAMPGISSAIVVTASHNPPDYNGLKCVLSGGRAITFVGGLSAIRNLMLDGYRHPGTGGSVRREDYHSRYLEFLRNQFPVALLREGHVALNGLNGTAGTMAGMIASEFELPVTWFRKEPGPMPSQGADPVNPRLVAEMKSFMTGQGFSLGVAWDGDCDRCVCFDNQGELIPTYYLIGLLAASFLRDAPGSSVVFDTKLCWNTLDIIRAGGGVPVPAETGHAFMKQKMHAHGAVYGGELSSHHYFGDFFGCDSGMMAWLTVLRLLAEQKGSIDELVSERRQLICCTPEISIALDDADAAFAAIIQRYQSKAVETDLFDGPSFSVPGDWRFSLRRSKTEPVVRINFESRGHGDDLLDNARQVLERLEPWRGDDRDWYRYLYIQ